MRAADPSAFAALLRRHRLAAGLSQEALAERARLSVHAVGALERGVHRAPYRSTVDLLAEALRLSPEERDYLHAAVARGRAGRRALPDLAGARLPAPGSSFVGRDHEQATVRRMLSSSRLVTLTGPGGVGKTRLALAVADGLRECFADGVWFVPLAALTDVRLVAGHIARALGIRESPKQPLVARLIAALQRRTSLLVLDNFEHLLTAAPLVAELLQHCPGLTALVTSREALRITPEQEFAVAPLALPASPCGADGGGHRGDPADVDLAAVAAAPAVQLFVQRAAAVDLDFALTAENAGTVAEICRRLDGLPLALELAAARLKVLHPRALLERLHRPLTLLTGGPRDALPRHQTLRATIAWSDEQLEEVERTHFRRLAVFAGGFTLEAADAVCHTPRPLDADTLDLVASLVDKSLLQRETRDGEVRFAMLETIREYALEQLAASGERERVRAGHAAYYLALAETFVPHVDDPSAEEWLARLEREHDNLRAALAWLIERGEAEAAQRLSGALWQFWDVRGHLTEGRAWLDATLVLDSPASVARAEVLRGAAVIRGTQCEYAAAIPFATKSVAILRAVGDREGLARALTTLAGVTAWAGDPATATALCTESLTIRRELGVPVHIAWSLLHLSSITLAQGDFAGARAGVEEGLSLCPEPRIGQVDAWLMRHLGVVLAGQGDATAGRALLERSLALFRARGEARGIAASLLPLADVARARGDPAKGRALLEECLSLYRELGESVGVAVALLLAVTAFPPDPVAETALAALRAELGDHALTVGWRIGLGRERPTE